MKEWTRAEMRGQQIVKTYCSRWECADWPPSKREQGEIIADILDDLTAYVKRIDARGPLATLEDISKEA